MGRKIYWTAIITYPFAIAQAIIACLILLMFLTMAIGVGSYMSNISSGTFIAFDDSTLRSITGRNIVSSVTPYFALIMTIIVLIAAAFVALSVLLCVGIWQNKPGNILVYVTFGGIVVIGRMSMLTIEDLLNFPEDKTVLYVGLYTLYLILLVVHVINIKCAPEQGAILAAPKAYPMAASAPSWSPTAPPAYKDANEYQALV